MAARNADLEAEIMADPSSSAAYLVYADWLLSHDDPRGELILVQLELETATGSRWAELRKHERTLFTEHAEHLLARSRGFRSSFGWRRGFVDRVDFKDRSEAAPELLSHPSLALVRSVADVPLAQLRPATLPHLRELEVRSSRARPVLELPTVRDLRIYRTSRPQVAPAQPDAWPETASRVETFAVSGPGHLFEELQSCRFPQLRLIRALWPEDESEIDALLSFMDSTPHAELELSLPGYHRGAASAEHLRRLQDPKIGPRVRGLSLDEPSIPDLNSLHAALPRLQRLHVGTLDRWRAIDAANRYELSVQDLHHLRTAVPHLRQQDLGTVNNLQPAHMAELPTAPSLREVALGVTTWEDPHWAGSLAAFATSPHATTIERLRLWFIDPDQIHAARRGAFPRVRFLQTGWSPRITAPEISALDEVFPSLEEVAIHARHLPRLGESRIAARIKALLVEGAELPDVVSLVLPALSRFTSLRVLHLAPPLPEFSPELIHALATTGLTIELGPHDPSITAGAIRGFERMW